MSDQEATSTLSPSSEPTIEEWHELLDVILANISCEVEKTVGYLLRTTPSGKAYLDKVKNVRPDLEIGEGLSVIDITDTYEASFVVDRLLANSLYGVDRDLYIHEFALTKSWVCETRDMYLVIIDLLRGMEKRAKTKKERDRFKEVRAAVERELTCEDVKAYLQVKPKKGGGDSSQKGSLTPWVSSSTEWWLAVSEAHLMAVTAANIGSAVPSHYP